MVLQQGYFLYLGNISSSFYENIDQYKDIHLNLIKLTIPYCVRNQAIVDLDKMGINSATLFPGIDGFCKSFKTTRIAKYFYEKDKADKSKSNIMPKLEEMKSTILLSFSIPNKIGALNAITSKFTEGELGINIHTMFLNEIVQSSDWDVIMVVDDKALNHLDELKTINGYRSHSKEPPGHWIY